MKNVIAIISLGFAACISFNVTAADVVFDPTNFIKNTMTAAQTASAAAKSASSYALQLQQYNTQLQNLRVLDQNIVNRGIGLGALNEYGVYSSISDVQREARSAFGVARSLENNLYSQSTAYQQLERIGKDLQIQAAATGKPVSELISKDIAAAKEGQLNAAKRFTALKTVNAQIQDYEGRRKIIAERIPANAGVMESMTTMSQSALTTNDQLSSLLQISADQRAEQNLKSYEEEVAKQREAEIAQSSVRNKQGISKSLLKGF